MPFLKLPNELLQEVIGYLERPRDLYTLTCTNRRLADSATPQLHKLALEDKDGRTALQWAAFGGSLPRTNRDDKPPKKYEGLARFLLDHGVDIDYFSKDPRDYRRCDPALHIAVHNNQIPILRLLLERGADINIKNSRGITALRAGLCSGMNEAVKLLLKYGADQTIKPNTEDKRGSIHVAALRCNRAVMAMLLNRGADVNDMDGNGQAALHWIARHGSMRARNYIDSRIPVIELLLEKGADIDIPDYHLSTPLHYAAFHGLDNLVELLLAKGADIEAINKDGGTPLLQAVNQGRTAAVKVLVEAGAGVTVRPGLTMVDWVAHSCCFRSTDVDNAKLIRTFLSSPQQVEEYIRCQPSGGAALYVAAKAGYDDIVTLLLDSGVKINSQLRSPTAIETGHWKYKCGGTVLHWAALGGSEKLVRLLIKRGADTAAIGENDQLTVLDWAIEGGNPGVISIFSDRYKEMGGPKSRNETVGPGDDYSGAFG